MRSFDAVTVAGRLLGCIGLNALRVEGGRNAEVWRIDAPDASYALKRYIRADAPERLSREVAALRFLERHDVANVPRVAAADAESGVILLSWLPGEVVLEATEDDITACVAFIGQQHELSHASDAAALPAAKEACGSVASILMQIDARIARLSALAHRDPALRRFVERECMPRRRVLEELRERYPNEFPRQYKTLNPSDFGVHNARRDGAGRLSFLDFEYFGWDDPAKLSADFILHPGMALPQRLQSHFADRVAQVFGQEADFVQRLAALLPAYQLRWALIMLNPVLDAAIATAHEGADFAAAVRMQTERAERFLRSPTVALSEEEDRYAH